MQSVSIMFVINHNTVCFTLTDLNILVLKQLRVATLNTDLTEMFKIVEDFSSPL